MKSRTRVKKFISAETYGFVIEPRYYISGWSASPVIRARTSTLSALKRAKHLLPSGYNFKIWDGQRTLATQKLLHRDFLRRVRKKYPNMTLAKRRALATRYSGGVVERITRLDTHRRGGSLDLTIVDHHGRDLDMGTPLDDYTKRAATDHFEKRKSLPARQRLIRKNRRLLKRVMTKAGFTNYAPEWWHWSYSR